VRPRKPGGFPVGTGRGCRDDLADHLRLCGRVDRLPCRPDAGEEGAQRVGNPTQDKRSGSRVRLPFCTACANASRGPDDRLDVCLFW
jgi:hypothetical protein